MDHPQSENSHEPSGLSAQPEPSGRERLLDAASRLFREGSFRDVSVADLTKAAGVQAPTLYHHFRDKEGLYLAWAERALVGLNVRIREALVGKTGTRESLAAIAAALLTQDELDLTVVLRDARREVGAKAQERLLQLYLAAVIEPLGSVLVRGVERGKLRPEPIARMAQAFVFGVLSLHARHSLEAVEPEDAAAWFAKRFLNGFSS
ncbi:MAG: TetR/AcrR family transcriptional regulator [Fimbriimonadales bacterium]|nr:TetR/AcrR family transcriptional regulator [Fimbriimonadales bacterium]